MAVRKLIVTPVKKYLESGDVIAAFLQVATDLEHILFQKLLFEYKIKSDLVDNWTLGRYLQWCFSLGLIDKKWQPLLQEFVKERNKLAHLRGYMSTIKQDSTKADKIKKLIWNVYEFLEQVEVKYVSDPILETEYGKHCAKHPI